MAYITKSKNREGKYYVYLKESYRVGDKTKTRILEKYGQYDMLEEKEPGSYERLRSDAKLGLLTDDAKKSVDVTLDLNAPIGVDSKNYGWKFLDEVYKHFGITKIISDYSKTKKYEYDLNSILKLLTFQRCLNPDSKLKNIEAQKEMHGTWNNKSHDCYRSLDDIASLQKEIQSKIGTIQIDVF
jgi:hypothetical protein